MKTLRIAGIIFYTLLFVSIQTMGQSKKTILEKEIQSLTVLELFIEEGIKEPLIEEKQIFNEDGELIELITYNKEGDVTKWEKYLYDEDGNIIEEIFLDSRGKIEKKEKTIFKEGLRVERQFFDNRDRMYKKKIYEYEYRK